MLASLVLVFSLTLSLIFNLLHGLYKERFFLVVAGVALTVRMIVVISEDKHL